MLQTIMSLQEFCINYQFPLTLTYRAINKYVLEYVQTQGRPEGKRLFDIDLSAAGFIVKDFGSKKVSYQIIDPKKFKFFLASTIGFDKVVNSSVIRDALYVVRYCLIEKNMSFKNQDVLKRTLNKVGMI